MPNFKDIEVNGKTIRINRLSVDTESEIWFNELAPRIAPLVGDLMNGVKSLVAEGAGMRGASPLKEFDFGSILRQVVKELPWEKVKPLAQRLLATTQHDGKLFWDQRNVILVSTWDLCTVMLAALELFYADFWKALASLPSLVASFLAGMKRSEGSTDTDTSTSSPSTTS